MLPRIGRWTCGLVALVTLIGVCGCVERRMVIVPTDSTGGLIEGAIVYDENDRYLGAGPADRVFTYYGDYQFRIAKDGYETQVFKAKARAPWYEWPGFDFVSENLIPWTIRDVRYFYPVLRPAVAVPTEQVRQPAQVLRDYAKNFGTTPIEFTPPATLMPPVP